MRRLEKLNWTHILALLVVIATVIVILVFTTKKAARDGIAKDIEFINTNTFLNVIGFSVYAYEGIGIVIPVM